MDRFTPGLKRETRKWGDCWGKPQGEMYLFLTQSTCNNHILNQSAGDRPRWLAMISIEKMFFFLYLRQEQGGLFASPTSVETTRQTHSKHFWLPVPAFTCVSTATSECLHGPDSQRTNR